MRLQRSPDLPDRSAWRPSTVISGYKRWEHSLARSESFAAEESVELVIIIAYYRYYSIPLDPRESQREASRVNPATIYFYQR